MKRHEIRLEALKLCINRTLSPGDNLIVARIYEEYIVGAEEDLDKNSDNPDVLSGPDDNRKDGGLTRASKKSRRMALS